MAFGPFPQQQIYDGVLSYQSDAQAYADAIGAKLVNAVSLPDRVTFGGLKPSNLAQPWVVQWSPDDPLYFAGVAIKQRAEVSGGSVTGPGNYVKQPDGVWDWVPAPVAPVPPPPTPSNPADAAAWATLMGATTLSTEQYEQQSLYYLRAIAHVLGIKAFGS
jgi:hypothetical protein